MNIKLLHVQHSENIEVIVDYSDRIRLVFYAGTKQDAYNLLTKLEIW